MFVFGEMPLHILATQTKKLRTISELVLIFLRIRKSRLYIGCLRSIKKKILTMNKLHTERKQRFLSILVVFLPHAPVNFQTWYTQNINMKILIFLNIFLSIFLQVFFIKTLYIYKNPSTGTTLWHTKRNLSIQLMPHYVINVIKKT